MTRGLVDYLKASSIKPYGGLSASALKRTTT
jgi:hypothetical protein